MVVDLPEPVEPVMRMIHLSANVAFRTESGRLISAGVGTIDGIIRIATLTPRMTRDILTRNLANHCAYDISSVPSSKFLHRRN